MVIVAAVCGTLAWTVVTHYIIRVVADQRVVFKQEGLLTAYNRFPNSPRVNYRLAEVTLANSSGDQKVLAEALGHAERAVNLSLWDFRMRQLLGEAQEINGDPEGAEKSMRTAARLAPNNALANWSLANVLLRRGKLDESLEPFRKAASTNDDLFPMIYELLWQFAGGDVSPLKTLAASNTTAQLSLVQFLLTQSLVDDALGIFRSIDRREKINSVKSAQFMRSLAAAGRFEAARSLWLDLFSASNEASPAGGLIWNGGFEDAPIKNFDLFDWAIAPSEYARISIDPRNGRTSPRSLKITFAGRDTTKLNGEVRQLVVLKPGARYLLECYAKTADLLSPEGPRIGIIGGGGIFASSEPVAEGSKEWQRLVVDFIAPADAAPKYVAVVRVPKYSYDDPSRGTVWFDDFRLVEQPGE